MAVPATILAKKKCLDGDQSYKEAPGGGGGSGPEEGKDDDGGDGK